jgi:hypothetical protein
VYAAFTTPVNSIGNLPSALQYFIHIVANSWQSFPASGKIRPLFDLIWATEEIFSMFICEEANAYLSREKEKENKILRSLATFRPLKYKTGQNSTALVRPLEFLSGPF